MASAKDDWIDVPIHNEKHKDDWIDVPLHEEKWEGQTLKEQPMPENEDYILHQIRNPGETLRRAGEGFNQSIVQPAKAAMEHGANEYLGYGLASKTAPEYLRNKIQNELQQSEKEHPVPSAIGGLIGGTLSPANLLIPGSGEVAEAGKLAKLLKMAKIIGSGGVQSIAGGYGHTGDEPYTVKKAAQDAVLGGTTAGLANKFPVLTSAAAVAASASNNDPVATLGASIPLAGIGMGIAARNRSASSLPKQIEKLKSPIEKLEAHYENLGKSIEPERRAEDTEFTTPNKSPLSDNLKSIFDKIDSLKIEAMEDISKEEKKVMDSRVKSLGQLRYKPLSEMISSDVDREKVLKLVDEMNAAKGLKEDAMTTINKQIELLKLTAPEKNPYHTRTSDFLIGRVMQTPSRHGKAMANTMGTTDKSSLPPEVQEHYLKQLELNQAVESGKLNKWYQNPDEHGLDTPDKIRLFTPQGKLLSPEEASKGTDQGQIVYLSPKDRKQILKDRISGNNPDKQKLMEDIKKLKEMKGIVDDKLPDPNSMILYNQDKLALAKDLNTMGEQSKWKNVNDFVGNNKDELLELYRAYKNSPDSLNKMIEDSKRFNIPKDQALKMIKDKNPYFKDILKNERTNEKISLKNASAEEYNRNLDAKMAEKQRLSQEKINQKEQLDKFKEDALNRVDVDLWPLQQRLYDMSEGRRQMGISRPTTNKDLVTKSITEAITDTPVFGKYAKSLHDRLGPFTESGKLEKYNKMEEHYRDQYGKGKALERGAKFTPELWDRNTLVGIVNQGGISGQIGKFLLDGYDKYGKNGVIARQFMIQNNPKIRAWMSSEQEQK